MNFFQTSLLTTGLLTATVAIAASPVSAAGITYDFEVLPDSGPLAGDRYTGSFSYDDSLLSNAGTEFLLVDTFSFSFLGQDYDETTGPFATEVLFTDGDFLGLNYAASDFSFIPGFFDSSEAFFAYQTDAGVGAADVVYTLRQPEQSVPEPTSAIALILAGALGTAALKQQAA